MTILGRFKADFVNCKYVEELADRYTKAEMIKVHNGAQSIFNISNSRAGDFAPSWAHVAKFVRDYLISKN